MGRWTLTSFILIFWIIQTTVLAQSVEPITSTNANRVEQLGILGFGLIEDADWSPDGKTVGVASSTGILFYDSNDFDQAPFRRWTVPDQINTDIEFSPDGSLVATLSASYTDTNAPRLMRLWEFNSGKLLGEWPVASQFYLFMVRLSFSQDDDRLFLLYDFEEVCKVLFALDISDTGNIRVLSDDDLPNIPEEAFPIPTNMEFLQDVSLIDFTADQSLIAGVVNEHVTVWEADTAREIFSVSLQNIATSPDFLPRITGLEFSPKGTLLYIHQEYQGQCGMGVGVWNIAEKFEVYSQFCLYDFHVSPDEKHLLSEQQHRFGLQLVNTVDGTRRQVLGRPEDGHGILDNHVRSVAFSPDGNYLYAARANAIEKWGTTNQVRISSFVPDIGYSLGKIKVGPNPHLISVSGFNTIAMYDMATFTETTRIVLSSDFSGIIDFVFSSDGEWLFMLSEREHQNFVTIWRIEELLKGPPEQPAKALVTQIFQIDSGPYDNLSVDSETQWLSVLNYDLDRQATEVVVYDIDQLLNLSETTIEEDAAVVARLPEGSIVTSVFSPDSTRLIVGNRMYDTSTWHLVCSLEGHTGVITDIEFTSDSSLIATSSGSSPGWISQNVVGPDNTIRIWDANTCDQLTVLTGHVEGIWDIAFSPNEAYLASGSGASISTDLTVDGTLRLWGVPN